MIRPVPLRAVVFDLDGTLLNSMPLVLAAITHALEPFGARPPAEIFAKLGGPPERFLATLVDDLNHVPAALERMENYHRQNAHLIEPYEGVGVLLSDLRHRGIQVAIWTGRDRATTDWLLRTHQLGGHFSTIVCGDDLPSHKPDPEGLREIVRRLGVRPEEVLFVGDADVDVLGGVGAGVDTLLIRHGREVELHIVSKSWRTVTSPGEAFEVLRACIENSPSPAPATPGESASLRGK